MTLADEPVRIHPRNEVPPDQPGKWLRVLACLVWVRTTDDGTQLMWNRTVLAGASSCPTYAEAMEILDRSAALAALPLRQPMMNGQATIVTDMAQITYAGSNPKLPDCLQDLANDWFVDVHEACWAFDDPDLWYPGVDEGIEPVSDEHVRLVIAATERELSREERPPQRSLYSSKPKLPWAPLHKLPWRVQQALVERRRLRFAQWGIGRAEWDSGTWSLWNIPEDPDWRPRWPVGGATR
jgi:hypothetical protein